MRFSEDTTETDAREREELLAFVERALLGGASRPADVLDAVPDLGTWDTAKSYVDEVRARWRDEASREERRAVRAELEPELLPVAIPEPSFASGSRP